jgi:GNAT superfamily N-acetyltransferase
MTDKLAPAIRTAVESDRPCLLATLTAAFATDPAARWTYPDDEQYRRHFPAFANAFGGRAVALGSAYCSGDFSCTALWLPPGTGPDEEAMVSHLERTAPDLDQAAMMGLFEEMDRHHPKEPHWYLPLIGVDPSAQGRGVGSALMRRGLEAADREHLPAYLESSNPKNIPLYERHGFELLGTIQKGSSPPIFPMLRRPR